MNSNQHKPGATIKHFGEDHNYHDTYSSSTCPDMQKTIENYASAGHKTLKKKSDCGRIHLYVKVKHG